MQWNIATDPERKTKQAILEIPAGNMQEPKFGTIMLPAKYDFLNSNSAVAGFFRMSGDPHPYIMARADGYVDKLKNTTFKLVYAFHRFPSGGLFSMFLSFDGVVSLGRITPSKVPVLEQTFGLDIEDTVDLIRKGICRNPAHIVFTGAGGGTKTNMIFDPVTGDFEESEAMVSPAAKFDCVIALPPDFAAFVKREFASLLSYHRSTKRDFTTSMRALTEAFPLGESPILSAKFFESASNHASPEKSGVDKEVEQTETAGMAKKWWQFWK